MGATICFKHRKRDCECIVPREQPGFKPVSEFLDRKNAHEIFYSCKAFKENVVYTPEVMALVVQNYITVANEFWKCVTGNNSYEDRAKLMLELKKKLTEAGWHDAGSGDSGVDSGHS